MDLQTAFTQLPRFTAITDYQIWFLLIKPGKATQKELRASFNETWNDSISENGLMIHMRFLITEKVIATCGRKGKALIYLALRPPNKLLFYNNQKYNYKKDTKKTTLSSTIDTIQHELEEI